MFVLTLVIISNGTLPDEFWQPNEFNVCGGIEDSFMSATTDAEVAFNYASQTDCGVLFEMRTGMVRPTMS